MERSKGQVDGDTGGTGVKEPAAMSQGQDQDQDPDPTHSKEREQPDAVP